MVASFLWRDQDRISFDTLKDSCFCSALEVIAAERMGFVLPNKELAVHALLASLNE